MLVQTMTTILQQVATAATPAVLVPACGLIAMDLDNQTERMATRVRKLTAEWRDLATDDARRAALREQVRALSRRHTFYVRALLLDYGALLAFVLAALLSLSSAFFPIAGAVPTIVLGFGALLLVAMASSVLAAVLLAREALHSEIRDVVIPPKT